VPDQWPLSSTTHTKADLLHSARNGPSDLGHSFMFVGNGRIP
jgi:hypothetical protein